MKANYVAQLADGDDLDNEPFLLQELTRRETKDGRPYLLGTLRDKTGHLGFVYWDVPKSVEGWLRTGMVVLVTGRVNSYRNALQITASDINPVDGIDMSHFLPASRRTGDDMVLDLKKIVAGLAEPYRSLVAQILLEPEFLEAFASAPAARSMHHAYVGGLLEHTLSMAAIAQFLADHYPYVNKDLLLAGVLMHDMAKTREYDLGAGFEFTHDGRLVGHVVRGVTMIEKAATEVEGLGDEELRQLVHLVASHHGNLEWGAPVVPKTLEAVLLHQIDLLDSRIQGFLEHVQGDPGSDLWTTRSSHMFNTELYFPREPN